MTALTDNIEFRGMEQKEFKSDQGDTLSMTLLRFDDETGQQNEFYVMDPSKVEGFDTLKRGGIYNLQLNIGRNNKLKILNVYAV